MLITGLVAAITDQSPLAVWDRWDTQWYVGIAAHGYHWSMHGKPALAFFPLYPLLLHLSASVGMPAMMAGLILSNLAFAAALLYLYLFASSRWDPPTATRAVWLFALFPTAFFTFATYTESLFLLCAVAAFYHGHRRQALTAGLWMAGALATRSTGIILVPAILLALEPHRWRARLCSLAPASAVIVGYCIYLNHEHLLIGRVLTAQRAWHRALTFPWTGFTASVSWLAHHGLENAGWTAENLFQLGVTALFLLLTAIAWRSLGRAEAMYCAAFWALVLTSPEWLDGFYAPFMSMNRFVLALFPLMGWMAARVSYRRFRQTIHISAVLMTALAALHLAGGWVG